MLGRQAVVDREHVRAGLAAEQPAGGVVGVQVAEHEAAAVEKDHQRVRAAWGVRHVVARAKRPRGALDGELAHGRNRDRRPGVDERVAAHARAGGGHVQIGQGREAELVAHGEHQLHLRIERLAVYGHGRLAREQHLGLGRQGGQRAGGPKLHALIQGDRGVRHRALPATGPLARSPSA
ncbi:hypothetical protein D3C72_772690 [compost metagenome]